MSRSALARQLQRQVASGTLPGADPFDILDAYQPDESQLAVAIPINGNSRTFNIEGLLARNIVTSNGFKNEWLPCMTLDDLIDGIYEAVTHVEPWNAGGARVASECFCALFRLGMQRPAPKDVTRMVNHKDSPFIRAVAFLFLRYCCSPAELWAWLEPYIDDPEEFTPGQGDPHPTTIGEWIRTHLLSSDNRYYMTVLPRLPVTVARDIGVQLLLAEKDAVRAQANAPHAHLLVKGAKVRARWSEDGKWYDAVVDAPATDRDTRNCKNKFWVTYTEFGNNEMRSLGQIDLSALLPPSSRRAEMAGAVGAPRAGTRSPARDERRDGDHDRRNGGRASPRRDDYDRRRGDSLDRERRRSPSPRRRSRSPRGRERDYEDARRSPPKDRYARDDGWRKSERRDYGDDYRYDDYDGRRRSWSRERDAPGDRRADRRPARRSRSPGEDRYRRRSPPRGARRSPSRERALRPAEDEDDIDALRRAVEDRERRRALASGSNYAQRPVGYKESLSLTVDSAVARRRSPSPASRARGPASSYHDAGASRKRSKSPSASRSPARGPPATAPAPAPAAAPPTAAALARFNDVRARYEAGAARPSAAGSSGRRIGVQDRDGEDVIKMRSW